MTEPIDQGPMDPTKDEEVKLPEHLDKPYTDMTPEEAAERLKWERKAELSEMGVSETQIEQWRKQYRRLATVRICDRLYIVRPLRRIEKRKIIQKAMAVSEAWQQEMAINEEIAYKCTLFPSLDLVELRNESEDGVVEEISKSVQELSGYGASAYVMEL